MFEVRFHGRGGQGVVTAADLLSDAASFDGLDVQEFPSFRAAWVGTPVTSYCRLDEQPIHVREPIFNPDAVVVLDPTLLHHVDVFVGVHGVVLLNSTRTAGEMGLDELVGRLGRSHVNIIDATGLAMRHLGQPLPSVCLLGALCAITARVRFASLERAVRRRFAPEVAAGNIAAARAAFDQLSPTLQP
jgi:pyruvate ferredoxin oxidoreductase gamma subunit